MASEMRNNQSEPLQFAAKVAQAKQSLALLLAKAEDELAEALVHLEEESERTLAVVKRMYDEENRRTKQHFQLVESLVEQISSQLDELQPDAPVPPSLRPIFTCPSSLPLLLTTKVLNIELEAAKLVSLSCIRNEFDLETTLPKICNPQLRLLAAKNCATVANRLAESSHFQDWEKAAFKCEVAESLVPGGVDGSNDTLEMLRNRISAAVVTRESDLENLMTEDCGAVKGYLKRCWAKVVEVREGKDPEELERMLKVALKGSISISRNMAKCVGKLARWYRKQGLESYEKAAFWLEPRLQIHKTSFPTALKSAHLHIQQALIYLYLQRYNSAEDCCHWAYNLLSTRFAELPHLAKVYEVMCFVCRATGRAEESLQYRQMSMQLDVIDPSMNYFRQTMMQLMGNPDVVRIIIDSTFGVALFTNPQHPA